MKIDRKEEKKKRFLRLSFAAACVVCAALLLKPEILRHKGSANVAQEEDVVSESSVSSGKTAESNSIEGNSAIKTQPVLPEEEVKENPDEFLYAPSMIKKIDDTYFIVDSGNHRIIYNDTLNTDFAEWKTLTDSSYVFGHSIDGNGQFLAFDNTDADQVFAFEKNENGEYVHQLTIGSVKSEPHYTVYDSDTDNFYTLSSENTCIYVCSVVDGEFKYIRKEYLDAAFNGKARSLSFIESRAYVACDNGYVLIYDYDEDCFDYAGIISIPECYSNLNSIKKIGNYYYLIVNSDRENDSAAGLYYVNSLSDIEDESLWQCVDIPGITGQPYDITFFDGRYWLTESSLYGGNGIWSLLIDEEGNICEVEKFWHSDSVLDVSKEKYASRYHVDEDVSEPETVDLMIFAGQSNMSGKGDAKEAPEVEKGYEFRAISDPTGLYNITEPFGINEFCHDGANDFWEKQMMLRKRGSLVSSFANTYYQMTGVPIVAVSCSEGASKVSDWLSGQGNHDDLMNRYRLAREYLDNSEAFNIRYIYLVWCQGESDGDAGISGELYYEELKQFSDEFFDNDMIDAFMVIQTGTYGENGNIYEEIRNAQKRFCDENDRCVMLSEIAKFFYEDGKMCDNYHYNQAGYNELGKDAGFAAARYSMKRAEADEQ